jgi:hypothetical protein
LLLLFVLIVVSLGARIYFRLVGKQELNATVARLDEEDPGWQIADITAARERSRPPENENAFPVASRVYDLIPKGYKLNWKPTLGPDESRPYNRRLPPPELLTGPHEPVMELENVVNGGEATPVGNLVESTEQARTLGLTLRAMPRGYRALEFGDDPIDVPMEPVHNLRVVAALMKDDALLAADSNDPVGGLRAAHACLNVGRAIGDEPEQFSQLARQSCGLMSAEATSRVLGLSDLGPHAAELSPLQAALLNEADEPLLLIALRANRAQFHLTFENLDNGKMVAAILAKGGKKEERGFQAQFVDWMSDGYFHLSHKKYLELMTKAVAIANQPPHQQLDAMRQLDHEVRALRGEVWGLKYWRCTLFMPPFELMTDNTLRHRAALRTAAAGIACERFRLLRGRWPTTLEEIPRDVLAAVPLDPYTGKALSLTNLEDGIAISSVGSGKDKKGLGGETHGKGPLGGTEIGCRLYDPKLRRLPPLPPKPTDDPFAQPDPNDEAKP